MKSGNGTGRVEGGSWEENLRPFSTVGDLRLRCGRLARKYASGLLKAGLIRHTVNKITFSEQCYYVFGDLSGGCESCKSLALAEQLSLPCPASPTSYLAQKLQGHHGHLSSMCPGRG
jgi:hypothetical protein